jgi:hypothetical protein
MGPCGQPTKALQPYIQSLGVFIRRRVVAIQFKDK